MSSLNMVHRLVAESVSSECIPIVTRRAMLTDHNSDLAYPTQLNFEPIVCELLHLSVSEYRCLAMQPFKAGLGDDTKRFGRRNG